MDEVRPLRRGRRAARAAAVQRLRQRRRGARARGARHERAAAASRRPADGRLHLHDGPIDLIIEAFGEPSDVAAAYAAAARRFATILDELCAELPLLRAPLEPGGPRLKGAVARRMATRSRRSRARRFITPMAAVAGAVAEEILAAMTARRAARARLCQQRRRHRAASGAGREASRRHGRSARSARACSARRDDHGDATACAASRPRAGAGAASRSASPTPSPCWRRGRRGRRRGDADRQRRRSARPSRHLRAPARDLDPQSDLGERLVTRGVGAAQRAKRSTSRWRAGAIEAEHWRRAGAIEAAALRLQAKIAPCRGARPSLYTVASRAPFLGNEKKARHAVG